MGCFARHFISNLWLQRFEVYFDFDYVFASMTSAIFIASMILKVNFATCEQRRIFRKGSSEALIAAMPVDGKSNASDWGCNKSELWLYTLQFAGHFIATSHDLGP